MPAPKDSMPLERVRGVLAARVEATSLRQAAREVGMSPSGLQKLLDGSQPYSATRRKLERWYVRETAQYGGTLSAGSALAALRVLVQDVPPAHQRPALENLAAALKEVYKGANTPQPGWLDKLQQLVNEE
jgi:hypothetical protein